MSDENMKLVPYFELFLDTYSESSKKHAYSKIVELALYCRDELDKGILEITSYELLTYFKNVIDKKEILKKTKNYYFYFISSYYNYVSDFKRDIEREEFHVPVPSKKIWDFSGKANPLVLDDINIEQKFITIDLIEKILHHIYYFKPSKFYYILSFIAYTGARISEILHLELRNIDLKNRWFITGVKSKKNDKRDGIYFFPQFFVTELTHYIKLLREEHGNPIYLFPSKVKGKHVTPRAVQTILREIKEELGIETKINPHAFRDYLNTKRFEKGCPEPILKFLLNQTVQDVNTNHYLKQYKNKIKLRDLYDRYGPFNKLLKPNPKL